VYPGIKKVRGIITDLPKNIIREFALQNNPVDIKSVQKQPNGAD
jgi:hypothetical protein